MSKTLKGGYCIVLGGLPKQFAISSYEDFGEDGTTVELENSTKRTRYGQMLKYYISASMKYGISLQAFMTDTDEASYRIIVPSYLLPTSIPQSINISYIAADGKRYSYVYVYETKEVELPDRLFDFFYTFSYTPVYIETDTLVNSDGVSQTIYNIRTNGILIGSNTIFPDADVAITGANEQNVYLRPNGSPTQSRALATSEKTIFKFTSPCTGGVSKDDITQTTQNYPHKPTIEKIVRNGAVFVRVTTNVPAHGNIYFNGGAEPAYTYITNRTAPYTAEIKIDKVGAYTANIISEVIMGVSTKYLAYGELSDTLIVETQNVECTLSFNEYTGIISCVPDIEGLVEKFTLQKENGSEWIDISENTTGEFHITEGGTYKIIPTFGIFYTGTVFPESITVVTTLNTPVAYSDPAFPSQLGFDEVENANIYDVYRVSEDGDDELVATISQNNIISRIMRKEKMFIVIPNDEVKNV